MIASLLFWAQADLPVRISLAFLQSSPGGMSLQALMQSGCVVHSMLHGLSMREVAALMQCGSQTFDTTAAMDFAALSERLKAWVHRYRSHIHMLPLLRLPSLAELEARQLGRDAWFRCQVMPGGEQAQNVIPDMDTWGHLERWFGLWRLCGAASPFGDGQTRFADTSVAQNAEFNPSRAYLLAWLQNQRENPIAQFCLANNGIVRTFVFDQDVQLTRVGSFLRAHTFIFLETSWHSANVRLIVSVGLDDAGDTLIAQLR
jgi:hypothetical protein